MGSNEKGENKRNNNAVGVDNMTPPQDEISTRETPAVPEYTIPEGKRKKSRKGR